MAVQACATTIRGSGSRSGSPVRPAKTPRRSGAGGSRKTSRRRSTTRCEPTPRALLRGLDIAYRQELERRGWEYPDLNASAPAVRADNITVETRYGPVEISWAVRDELVEEIRRRGSGGFVARVFDAIGAARPVNLDRKGRIVVLDGIWGVAESSAGDLDPQLAVLRDRLANEITEGTS